MEGPKLRVVQIIDRLHIGGAERILVMLSNILFRHGHSLKVITTVGEGPLTSELEDGIERVNLERKWKWNVITMRKLVSEIEDYDVIHVHSSHNLRYVYLAMKLFHVNKPIFFHEHYGDIHIDPSIRWHQKLVYPKVIFIGVSRKHTQWAIEKLRMPEEQVFLLPNTVEKVHLDKSQTEKRTDKHVLLVSNFRTSKNIQFAIRVFNELKAQEPHSRLTIIGQVADKEYYELIKDQIRDSGLKDDVEIRHDCSNVQPFLQEFDFALHTAVSESGPLVLIEYMAQGLPFLTYNTGEVVQEIKGKMPLAVMDSFDTREWVTRLKELLGLPLADLSDTLMKLYDHYFSAEVYYNKLMTIYQAGLSRSEKIASD
jgi:glycosyltransferase involved in cell wall biosynthesis